MQASASQLAEQLDMAVAEFLQAEEAGRPLERTALLERYPEVAADLQLFFEAHQRLTSLAAPLRQSVEYVVQRWETQSRTDQPTIDFPERQTADRSANGSPRIGSRFGDYELVEELGRGGMGVVFKARHVRLNRLVALKMVLAGRFADDQDVNRFRAEALTAAALDHPGIVPIHEAGEVDGLPYFSMSLVEGDSLADLVKAGPLSASDAARLLRKIVAAVAYAHEQGVIHRDLKPANILLARGSDGRLEPKITDFGLARRMDVDSHLTNTGQVLGTPAYMSPEQAAGRPHNADAAADVYSLGAILYVLLTGRPPFLAPTAMEVLLQVLEQDPPALRTLQAAIPQELEWICLKCLEKRPEDRYRSAGELADDLERFLRQEPPEARAGPLWHRLRRWGRREPVFVAHLAGLSLILLLTQLVFAGHAAREIAYHLQVCGLIGAWLLTCWILQLVMRRRSTADVVSFAWSAVDVGFVTALLYVLVAPIGLLLSCYHVLICAASLFFRTRLVTFTTALSMFGSGLLLTLRRDALGPWHYGLFLEATLALTGFFVGYHVWRLAILRDYYEERRGR